MQETAEVQRLTILAKYPDNFRQHFQTEFNLDLSDIYSLLLIRETSVNSGHRTFNSKKWNKEQQKKVF